MIDDQLNLKLRQMHGALGAFKTTDLEAVRVLHNGPGDPWFREVDFSADASEVDLANTLSLLLTNIGCLRDHLKLWCAHHGKPFEGDNLINTNQSCAVVHDLWNTDKHGHLDRKPRSGQRVTVVGLCKGMKVSQGAASFIVTGMHVQGGNAFGPWATMGIGTSTEASSFGINLETGEKQSVGKTEHVLTGTILNEAGDPWLGLDQVISQAVEAWEKCLRDSGVPIPT